MGLEIVELVLLAEEQFEVEIKDEDMAHVSTCGQFCILIERQLMNLTGKNRREIWPQVRQVIADSLSVPLEKVTWEADFIRDLGVG